MINEAKKSGLVMSGPAGDKHTYNSDGVRSSSAGTSVERPHLYSNNNNNNSCSGDAGGADGLLVDPEILKDKVKAFEVFRTNYSKNEAIEANKKLLKDKYEEVCVCIYIYMHIYIYTHTYIYIHAHVGLSSCELGTWPYTYIHNIHTYMCRPRVLVKL